MNRTELRRARELLGRARSKNHPWAPWVWCDLKSAPFVPHGLLKAAKNNCYVVQFYAKATPFGNVDHLMIQANDGTPAHNWAHFQRIKNELCGHEREAVEIYPPASELVDDCNVYHLWVFPVGVRIGFGLVPPTPTASTQETL